MDRIVESFADYASTLTYRDLPAAVVAKCRDIMVDTVGCAMAAHDCDMARIGRSLAGPPASDAVAGRVIGSKKPAAADAAAFVNASMIRNLDFNDMVQGAHPSDMLGGLFALAPRMGVSGEKLITAMVVAYETCIRLTKSGMREKGWDQGFGIGIGTAAAAGNLLGLDRVAIRHAIAITAVGNTQMRNTRSGQLSMWKGAATAYAVRNAVFGTQLAAGGATGPEAPFTGRHGLFDLITGPFELEPFGNAVENSVMPGVSLKYWPVAYNMQPAIWAGIELRKRVAVDEIESMDLRTYAFSVSESGSEPAKWDPKSRETADHSIPYVLARSLLFGLVDEEAFAQSSYLDPAIRPLMSKITVSADDEMEREIQRGVMHARLIAKDRAGRTHEIDIVNPIGYEKNPLSAKDIAAKFKRLCDPVLGKRRATKALKQWLSIETAADVKDAFDALIVKPARS